MTIPQQTNPPQINWTIIIASGFAMITILAILFVASLYIPHESTQQAPVPTPTQQPTPVPTPTPEPIETITFIADHTSFNAGRWDITTIQGETYHDLNYAEGDAIQPQDVYSAVKQGDIITNVKLVREYRNGQLTYYRDYEPYTNYYDRDYRYERDRNHDETMQLTFGRSTMAGYEER